MFQKKIKHKDFDNDVQINIPSAKLFFETLDAEIRNQVAYLDSQDVLDTDDKTRINHLIEQFENIARTSVVTTLIKCGFKAKSKKSLWQRLTS